MVNLTTGIIFRPFTYMHFWVWGILRRWPACAPTAYEVVRDCRKFEKTKLVQQSLPLIFTVNSDYFLKQHYPTDLCNSEVLCSLWGTEWILKYYWAELRIQRVNWYSQWISACVLFSVGPESLNIIYIRFGLKGLRVTQTQPGIVRRNTISVAYDLWPESD
jgi:hypothetical protein